MLTRNAITTEGWFNRDMHTSFPCKTFSQLMTMEGKDVEPLYYLDDKGGEGEGCGYICRRRGRRTDGETC